ncbi:MAG: chemotaxis response regulator protein-glutamate methylesterase [Desulfarculales bacterium]|jgi:two-component system chemotaxis response regulator CheB|nr:chemotaxis response regulator protein-glutamate methylesterase [Desulfarculales bacterium]
MLQNKIKVMVVDDSALIREFLRQIITEQPDMQAITASDPYMARDKMLKEMPDVMILDIEMPRMDGITFLKHIMNFKSIPVIMFSSLTKNRADLTVTALSMGAVDVIAKPSNNVRQELDEMKEDLLGKIRAVTGSKVRRKASAASLQVTSKIEIDAVLPLRPAPRVHSPFVVLMGASTGGTEALEKVLLDLPADSPPIFIVQHMPEHLTLAFANRLNAKCKMNVSEAADGQEVAPGNCVVAPGGPRHMMVEKGRGGGYQARLLDAPPVNRHRPSVDVLFRSGANVIGGNALAVIMTGMGDDGAQGMKDLHDAGAATVAQNEQTCVVYGMPKVAVQKGGVDKIIPLGEIASIVIQHWQRAR